MDRLMKDVMKIFKDFSLSITVTINLTTVDFLDVALDQITG